MSTPRTRTRATIVVIAVAALLTAVVIAFAVRGTSAGVTADAAPGTTVPAGAEASTAVGPAPAGPGQGPGSAAVAPGPTSSVTTTVVPGATASPDPTAELGAYGVDHGPGSPQLPTANLPVTVSVTPAPGTADTVAIRVAAAPGAQVYGFEARLCSVGAPIAYDADFNPSQGGRCIAHPLAGVSDTKVEAVAAAPYQVAEGQFRLAPGQDSYPTQNGTTAVIRCGGGSRCQLALKIQITDGYGFRTQEVAL